METTNDKGWSPYLAGALAGVLIFMSVLVANKFVGASTTFARSAGMIENTFAPDKVEKTDYFVKYKPKFDWQWLFVAGIFIGALISATSSKTFKWQAVPDMWSSRFGGGPVLRGIAAFFGGVIVIFGARLAGGCPSGHGLSGVIQMSISGFIAAACFFGAGIFIAGLLYRERRKGGEQNVTE